MKILFFCYSKCNTCQKARKWLHQNNIQVEERDIVRENPTQTELERWVNQSNISVHKLFNTSGILYKSLGLKDKIPTASFEELIHYLASNGKLVKRPVLIISIDKILVGFKEEEWGKALL